jgi:hypothetical protein
MKRGKTINITPRDVKLLNEARRKSGLALEAAYAEIGKRVMDAAGVDFSTRTWLSADKTKQYSAGPDDAVWSQLRPVHVKPDVL